EGTDVEWLYETVRQRILQADRSQHDDATVEQRASREHIMEAIQGALEKFGDANTRRRGRLIPGATPADRTEVQTAAQEAQARLDQALQSNLKRYPWQSK